MRDWLSLRRAATPEALALHDADTDSRWTYAELDADVERLAGRLAALGLTADDRIGILADTSPDFVRLLWAVRRVGATLIPFNARLTAGEIRGQRQRLTPALIVTDAANESTAVEAAGSTPVASVDRAEHESVRSLESTTSDGFEPSEQPLSETAVVLFTSGTTGDPKPVEITRRNLLASATASAFRLGALPDDRWLLTLPMYHMGGLAIPIRTTLYGSATVLVRGFDPKGVVETLRSEPITGVSLVPTMLRRLLETGGLGDSLRFALVGGGPTSAGLATHALEAGVPLHTTYGMTETASQITTATPGDLRETPDTVGRPLLGTDLAILSDDGERLETGQTGEIAVSGYTVSPGYVDGPTRSSDEWFRTGDLGYRDESGRLFVTGRADDLIVSGGENVAPTEVRNAILRHTAVEDAAVVGVPDDEWGESVGAVVVADSLSAAELESFLEADLAGYKRPRRIRFVESLPRTASGTVDREAARTLLEDTNLR